MTKLRQSLTTADDLVEARLVTPDRREEIAAVAERYAIALTPTVAGLIDGDDPNDPIARQFVPSAAELVQRDGERADPIGDDAFSPVPGLVHRYADRVLLKLAAICPVYCRFCFRREMVGPGHHATLSEPELAAALAYLAARPAIWEVIVTGGDPLVLSPRRLADVLDRIDEIEHVRVVRFHTRVPVVAPERIDASLVAALKSSRKTVYVALHANHPREMTPAARAALARLADAGIALVSQSVLLKGVNDDVATLEALMRGFVEARVKPYYLHHGDLAPGTGHLRTTLGEGQALMKALRGRLSGLAQPAYVVDIPGGHGKVPATAAWIAIGASGGIEIEDPSGRRHRYDEEA
jgi:lysine 2,3-aminomutase